MPDRVELPAGAVLATESESTPSELRVLRVSLDPEQARAAVSRFFAAVAAESSQDLFQLLAAHAAVVSEGNRQPAQAMWRTRFAQLDYKAVGVLLAGPRALRTYTFDAAERARRDGISPPSSPREVVVVARPSLSWVGKTRLFGDQLSFRLRPSAGDSTRFEIAEIAEDFRLP
jgi:hypothetical protein